MTAFALRKRRTALPNAGQEGTTQVLSVPRPHHIALEHCSANTQVVPHSGLGSLLQQTRLSQQYAAHTPNDSTRAQMQTRVMSKNTRFLTEYFMHKGTACIRIWKRAILFFSYCTCILAYSMMYKFQHSIFSIKG